MCEWISGEAVYVDEQTVRIYTCPDIDWHTDIRKIHNITEDNRGALHRRHTPVEFIPTTRLDDYDSYKLKWDAGKTDWWTGEHTIDAIRQFKVVAEKRYKRLLAGKKFDGYIFLNRLKDAGELQKIGASGHIYLNSLTDTGELQKIEAGIYISLDRLTDAGELKEIKAGGYISLHGKWRKIRGIAELKKYFVKRVNNP